MEIKSVIVARPVCNSSNSEVYAIASMDTDLTYLQTYLNAVAEKPRYYPGVPYVAFRFEGRRIVVERDEVRGYGFDDDASAREGIDRAVDYLREVDSRRDDITPSDAPYRPPHVMDVYKTLPKKTGCGKCGHPTCMAFATAVAAGEAELEECVERDPASG